jgi:hypothetical protein
MPRRSRPQSDPVGRLEDWNSQAMPDGTVAIAYPVLRLRRTEGAPSPAEAVVLAMTDECAAVVREGDIARFLRAHADRDIVCHRAEELVVALREGPLASPDGGAAEVLRRLCDENRLHDVGLFDQLVRLASSDEHPAPLVLGRVELADADLERCRALAASLPAGVTLDPPGCLADLARIRSRYLERRRIIRGVIEASSEEARRYGPLTLGLQVGAKVALLSATRAGIRFAKHSSGEVLKALRDSYVDAHDSLRKSGEAASWLPRSPDPAKDVNRPHLRAWLERRGNALIDDNRAAFRLPRTAEGVAVLPELWGELVRVDPLLRAWADLNLSKRLIRAVVGDASGECVLRPRYEVIPQVRSINPDLRELRRLSGPLRFVPRPGRCFLVGRISRLELHCFAKYVEEQQMPSSLSGQILNGRDRDPVRHVATLLLSEEGEEDCRNSPSVEARSEDGQPPGPRLARLMQIVEICFEAAMRGLSSSHARTILRLERGIDLSESAAASHWARISGMYQELELATEDATFGIVLERLGCEAEDLSALNHPEHPERTGATLRSLLAGHSENPRLFRLLRDICRD